MRGRVWRTSRPTQEGETIAGIYEGFFGEAPVTGTIGGDAVTLSIEFSAQGQVGTVDGNSP